ncbi:ABC transporter ATP-binding protein [Natronococcus sp.]|uniref:ABC transporter ATP-binding protein n=1 Tax=Natronococcus sp. TaxID=35747 RepID=UPI003A4E34AA
MSAIRTNDLTKQYGSQTVVSKIDLEVEAGEVYGFLGPNGAGKSTTIAMLLSYVHPTDGTARVLGRDVRKESAEIKRRIGVLPEQYQLYDRLSGRKHLRFAIDSMGASDDPDALADRVELETTAVQRPVGEYSTGMKQRLRIALALVGEPELLVLDEPSSGLDPAGIRLLREIVVEERDRGAAVFFSSHVLEQVEEVSDRIGILVDGELRMSGDLEELKSKAGAAVKLEVETNAVFQELLTAVESVESVTGCAVTDSGPEAPSLSISLSSGAAKADVFRAIEAHATIEDFVAEERSLESLFEQGVAEASR